MDALPTSHREVARLRVAAVFDGTPGHGCARPDDGRRAPDGGGGPGRERPGRSLLAVRTSGRARLHRAPAGCPPPSTPALAALRAERPWYRRRPCCLVDDGGQGTDATRNGRRPRRRRTTPRCTAPGASCGGEPVAGAVLGSPALLGTRGARRPLVAGDAAVPRRGKPRHRTRRTRTERGVLDLGRSGLETRTASSRRVPTAPHLRAWCNAPPPRPARRAPFGERRGEGRRSRRRAPRSRQQRRPPRRSGRGASARRLAPNGGKSTPRPSPNAPTTQPRRPTNRRDDRPERNRPARRRRRRRRPPPPMPNRRRPWPPTARRRRYAEISTDDCSDAAKRSARTW